MMHSQHRIHHLSKKQTGSALVLTLVFVATALILTSAAVILIATNSVTTTRYALSEEALAVAEAGIDNAVLRLVRDPSYTGEVLNIGNGTATISVAGSETRTITAIGVVRNFRRTVQATGSYTGTVFTLESWAEQE